VLVNNQCWTFSHEEKWCGGNTTGGIPPQSAIPLNLIYSSEFYQPKLEIISHLISCSRLLDFGGGRGIIG